ncbi:hypothetical protein Tco_0760819 [Tanacetum coccineum]
MVKSFKATMIIHWRFVQDDQIAFPKQICQLAIHFTHLCKLSGILNRECAVLPDGSSSDAIPEDATASTILSSERIWSIFASRRGSFNAPIHSWSPPISPRASHAALFVWDLSLSVDY